MDRYYRTESVVIDRKVFNHFNHEIYGIAYEGAAKWYYLRCLLMPYKFDIVHIHSLDQLMLPMRLLHFHKPLVMHYHGTKVRGKWSARQCHWKHADRILCSTDDLLEGAPENTVFLPNLIDFEKIPQVEKKIKKAFFCNVKDGWANDLAIDLAKQYDLELIIHERDEQPLPHVEFLEKIATYEYFIDVRRESTNTDEVLQSLSLTALEALASGSKVIDWNGDLIEDFPVEHSPKYVTSLLYDIYREIS
jgi:hypothetical protein